MESQCAKISIVPYCNLTKQTGGGKKCMIGQEIHMEITLNNENVQEFTVYQAQSSKGGLHFEILNCKPAQRSALDSNLSIV